VRDREGVVRDLTQQHPRSREAVKRFFIPKVEKTWMIFNTFFFFTGHHVWRCSVEEVGREEPDEARERETCLQG